MKTRRKSSLAAFENLSPNCGKPRKKAVKRLGPHCMAFNGTAERCLSLTRFKTYDPDNGASCSYSIGSNGRIGLGVEETNRPWTTSSSKNDDQAITFEIANNGSGPDWRMSDEAINAWLDLSVDICRFYGYKKVHYEAKPASVGAFRDAHGKLRSLSVVHKEVEAWIKTWEKPDEMIVTLHRWFKAKACPGPYFMRQLPWLVREMNKRLAGNYTPQKFVGENASSVILKKGSKGDKVKALQTRLNIHGAVPALTVDGDFGELTETQVEVFQRKKGLTVNGIVMTDTWKELEKDPIVPRGKYAVRVSTASLNVRSGPGTNHPIVRVLHNTKEIYNIVDEFHTPDGALWGQLSTGKEWINLHFTTHA